MKPSLTKIVTLSGSLDTRGGEDIIIVGNNFGTFNFHGTVAHEQEILAAPTLNVIYASQIPMDSMELRHLNAITYNVKDYVVVVKHTQIRCKSVPGVGRGHHYKSFLRFIV